MANSPIIHWQQWESRVQEWLNRSGNELILIYTTPSDRRILVVLTVKYQLLYVDMDKLERKQDKVEHSEKQNERLFLDLNGHYLKSAQAAKDTSSQ